MGKDKAPRNLWRKDELRCLVDIFKEKKILSQIERRTLSVPDIYKGVEYEMKRRGFPGKTAKQIHNRWNQMKSAYICLKRNHNVNAYLTKDLEFRNDVEELLKSQVENRINIPSPNKSLLQKQCSFPRRPEQKKDVKDNVTNLDDISRVGSYRKAFDRFFSLLKAAEKDIQNEFIRRQRYLYEFERRLQAERDNQFINAFALNINAILNTTNHIFS